MGKKPKNRCLPHQRLPLSAPHAAKWFERPPISPPIAPPLRCLPRRAAFGEDYGKMSRQQNYSVSSPLLPTPRLTWSRCSSSSYSRAALSGDLMLHLSKRAACIKVVVYLQTYRYVFFFIFFFFKKRAFFHFHTLGRKWQMVSRILRGFWSSFDANTLVLSVTDLEVQLCPGMPSRLGGDSGGERLYSMRHVISPPSPPHTRIAEEPSQPQDAPPTVWGEVSQVLHLLDCIKNFAPSDSSLFPYFPAA